MTSVRQVLAATARPLGRLSRPARRSVARRLAPRGAELDRAPSVALVHPDAEAYVGEPLTSEPGRVGVLLCHGFSGSPKSMVGWAQHLQEAGFGVSVPRLPGHGTSWQELNLSEWTDWYATVKRAFLDLEDQYDQVFVVGLSMGGALSLRLAIEFGDRVAGLVLVNPVISTTDPRRHILFLLQRIFPSLDGIANDIAKPGVDECGYDRNPLRALYSATSLWAEVIAGLPKIDHPLLVFTSTHDHVGDPSSLALIRERVSSADTHYVVLSRSYHVATLDYEAEQIFAGSVEFFRRLVRVS